MARTGLSRWIPWFLRGTVASVAGLAVALSLLARLGQSTPIPPSSILFEKDLAFANVEGKPLLLDLARPKTGAGPFPVVLCIHGGGWRMGEKSEFLGTVFSLAEQGYVTATVNYRLAPAKRFPSQIQDVKTAVRCLRSRAKELNIDPDHVGVLGSSAGGHLALLLGTTEAQDFPPVGEYPSFSSAVQAVVSIAGPTDLTRRFPDASEWMAVDLIGKSREEAPKAYERASPLYHVSPTDAPVLAIHGTRDELVPYEQSIALAAALKNVGVEADVFTIQNGGHGSGGNPEDWKSGLVKMVQFFDKHLKPASKAAPRLTP